MNRRKTAIGGNAAVFYRYITVHYRNRIVINET
jgi:hypothetical protein